MQFDPNHHVALKGGLFDTVAGTTKEQLDQLFANFKQHAQNPEKNHLVINFHGGFVDEASAVRFEKQLPDSSKK